MELLFGIYGRCFLAVGDILWAYLLQNALRARTACTSSASQLPNVARNCSVLRILSLKCASPHNGVRFFPLLNSHK